MRRVQTELQKGENCRENPMAVEIQPFSVSNHTLLLWIYAQVSLTVSDSKGKDCERDGTWKSKSMAKSMLLRSTYYYSCESASSPLECARAGSTYSTNTHTRTHGTWGTARVECAESEPNRIYHILYFHFAFSNRHKIIDPLLYRELYKFPATIRS